MAAMPIRWKTSDFLKANNISGYRFWKESGLPKRSAYRIVNGDARNFNADTLDATIRALRGITGKQVGVADLLEYEGEDDA